ncbi:MAG: DUF4956 domain-containing protein [Gemmatimonadota bacterium]|nr:DUF4956 domain-containing protein [Gemmatimonadota bacterium]
MIYYAILAVVAWFASDALPRSRALPKPSLDLLFGSAPTPGTLPMTSAGAADSGLAFIVGVAMVSTLLLSLPVAWIYVLTRAKRGYQQSVVHLLVILPLVVAGIVVLVKDSLPLAFSLAGIVAAVRFRNTLEDSKDAVYVFLATAIGLAAAVNVPVAAVISVLFNITVVTLWYTDFAHTPVALEGRLADQRLKKARQLARTGTFVARIDQEVFRDMTREQLESVAERAWNRAHEKQADSGGGSPETVVRIRTRDVEELRRIIEPRLTDHVSRWRMVRTVPGDGNFQVVEYSAKLKKETTADDLLALVRSAGGTALIDAEII